MKVINYIKKNCISWLVTLCEIVFVFINFEYSNKVNSVFLHYLINIIPLFIIILPSQYGIFSFSLEENLWDDLTIGNDPYIDKIMRILKIIIYIILVLTLLWILVNLYVFINIVVDFNIYINILRFVFPISMTIYLTLDYYKLSKQYNTKI